MENGALANFIIVLIVSLYGIYWLFNRSRVAELEFRRRAYRYWWCSWAAWTVVWYLLYRKSTYPNQNDFIPSLDIPVLIFDNLNSIFLLVVYIVITRGREVTARQAGTLVVCIILSIGILYGSVYFIFNYFYVVPKFAYEIHRSFSMCIAVFTPILVGWAFNLRFKTSVVLVIGCLYGLIQPVIYATELNTFQQSEYQEFQIGLANIKPAVAMITGLLKVAWVIIFTRVLENAKASSENLILTEKTNISHIWKGGSFSVRLHSIVLIAVYIVLLSALTQNYNAFITTFGAAFAFVMTIIGLWQFIWWVWKTTEKPHPVEK